MIRGIVTDGVKPKNIMQKTKFKLHIDIPQMEETDSDAFEVNTEVEEIEPTSSDLSTFFS